MTRNLKALGLALIAAFAMSAVAASAAQAEVTLTPASFPAVLTSSALGAQKYVTNTGQEVSCTGVGGHATIKEPGDGDTTVTVTDVTYSGCTAKVGASTLPATVDMNGCDFQFHGGTDTGGGHFVGGTVTILGCSGTGPAVTIFASAAKHAANEPLCTITVWASTIGAEEEITVTNTAGPPNDVDLKAVKVVNPVSRDGSILCGNPANATYNGEVTVRAYEDLGVHPNGTITEGNQIGLTASTS